MSDAKCHMYKDKHRLDRVQVIRFQNAMPEKRIYNISRLNHDVVEEESSSVEEYPQKGPGRK